MRRSALLLAAALTAAACGADGTDPAAMPADDLHYRWQAGDCLDVSEPADLPHEPFGRAPVVVCDDEHTYEVVFAGDLPAGEDDPYPEDLAQESWEACAAAFHDYVGAHLSETRLDLVVYRPDRTEWAGGLRYRTCLVEDPGGGGTPQERTGSLRNAGPDVLGGPVAGECFAGRSLLGPSVPCTEPHLAEAIGRFTYPAAPGEAWPGAAEARREADRGCAGLLMEYAASGEHGTAAVPIAFPRPLSRAEWDDGLRTVACGALVFDGDRHHVEVVGSLADPDWAVVRAAQAA